MFSIDLLLEGDIPLHPESLAGNKERTTKSILIIEDNAARGELLMRVIAREPSYLPMVVRTSVRVETIVRRIRPDLVVLSYDIGFMDGLNLINRFRSIAGLEAMPAIILTVNLDQFLPARDQQRLVANGNPRLNAILHSIKQSLTPLAGSNVAGDQLTHFVGES